jgi:hypothetical protein
MCTVKLNMMINWQFPFFGTNMKVNYAIGLFCSLKKLFCLKTNYVSMATKTLKGPSHQIIFVSNW